VAHWQSRSTRRGTDSQEYLKKEERALIDAVRERAEQRAEQEKKQKEREKRKPVNIPVGHNVVNLQLAPNGKYVIATISEPAAGAKNIIVPNYVTESAYTEDIPGRSKVGDVQARTRLMIIDVETGEAKNVDHGQKAGHRSSDASDGAKQKADLLKPGHNRLLPGRMIATWTFRNFSGRMTA
jgi:hypothetical protein